MTRDNKEQLVIGILVDLAILMAVFGLKYGVTALSIIGVCGFILACSPALMAAPLAPLFGLYLALCPFILLIKWLVRR